MRTRFFRTATAALTVVMVIGTGCGAATLKQMVHSGGKKLSAKKIHDLVSGHNLHMSAVNFNAQVLFKENSKLAARTRDGKLDTGIWNITTNDLLCMEFNTWNFGDKECYVVGAKTANGPYLFFTESGAHYYTAQVLKTIPAALISLGVGQKNSSIFDRKGLLAPQPVELALPLRQREAENVGPDGKPSSPDPHTAEMKRILVVTARDCPNCRFPGLDLSGSDLVGASLPGADLSGTDLSGTNLRHANLRGTNLSGATLQGANLIEADLSGADLTDTDFSGASLIKADLTGARIKHTIFTNALLIGAKGIK